MDQRSVFKVSARDCGIDVKLKSSREARKKNCKMKKIKVVAFSFYFFCNNILSLFKRKLRAVDRNVYKKSALKGSGQKMSNTALRHKIFEEKNKKSIKKKKNHTEN